MEKIQEKKSISELIKDLTIEERQKLYNSAVIDREYAKEKAIKKYPKWFHFNAEYKCKRLTEIALQNFENREKRKLSNIEIYFYRAIIILGSDEEFSEILQSADNKNDIIIRNTGISNGYISLRKLIYKLNQAQQENNFSNSKIFTKK